MNPTGNSPLDNPTVENSTEENLFTPPTAEPRAPGIEWMQTATGDFTKTRIGLSLVYFGILIVLLAVAVLTIGNVAAQYALYAPHATRMITLAGTAGLLIGGLMIFVGPFFCLAVPAATRARGLIIGSVVCQALFLVTVTLLLVSFLPITLVTLGMVLAAPLISLIAIFLSNIFFVLFMRRLAIFIGRMDLAERARKILTLTGVVIASFFGLGLVVDLMGPGFILVRPGSVLSIAILVLLVVSVVLFVRYANLVNDLRLAFSPNGQRIVSGGDDKTVKIWDASETALPATPNKAQTKVDEPSIQAVDASKLVKKSGLIYERDSETPFTGVMVKRHENGQKEREATYKDGKQEGLATTWYENGQKWSEATYKDGKQEGLMTGWYDTGQKAIEATYKDGKKVSETKWDKEGNARFYDDHWNEIKK